MRTFIAIPLPEKCREMLKNIQQSLRATEADVRMAAISSIHLTLKFLGDIESTILPHIAQSLRTATKSGSSMNLKVSGLGCFPNLRNPRVVWCAVHGDMDRLSHLQTEVERVCAEHGFSAEDRPFSPHLTLCRVKSKRNLQPLVDCIKMGMILECEFIADHINFYESTLTPHGAVYRILETIPLNAVH
jgi:RNA 2',3'-cyclic 3'-phosphodiesterase